MSQELLFISISLLLGHLSATLTSLQPHLVKCPAVHLDFFPPFPPSNNIKAIYRKKNLRTCLVVLCGAWGSRWFQKMDDFIFSSAHSHTHTEPISHPATVSRGCCSSPQNYQRLIKSTSGTFCQVWPRPVKRSSSLTDFCYFFPTSLMNVAVSYWVILTVLYACVAPVWRC